MGVCKNEGTPIARWMVYFMENPIYKWMMAGIFFGGPPGNAHRGGIPHPQMVYDGSWHWRYHLSVENSSESMAKSPCHVSSR